MRPHPRVNLENPQEMAQPQEAQVTTNNLSPVEIAIVLPFLQGSFLEVVAAICSDATEGSIADPRSDSNRTSRRLLLPVPSFLVPTKYAASHASRLKL